MHDFNVGDQVRLKGTNVEGVVTKCAYRYSDSFNQLMVKFAFSQSDDMGNGVNPDFFEKVEPKYTLDDIRPGDRVTWSRSDDVYLQQTAIAFKRDAAANRWVTNGSYIYEDHQIYLVERANYSVVKPGGTK